MFHQKRRPIGFVVHLKEWRSPSKTIIKRQFRQFWGNKGAIFSPHQLYTHAYINFRKEHHFVADDFFSSGVLVPFFEMKLVSALPATV